MFLKKIELQGFKSFANKTELQFNRNLTSIVGPNGSGKSNIADAIRWVTGEQSQKILRTKKAEGVIFAGSDKKHQLGMAEVSLFLDNSDGKIPLDYKEVVITRRVFRTGESEYIINKTKVRLIDIQLLLAKANFGQHNYSIIGQGMIDSILSQSASSRKSFFDEATGVKVYQIKKEKSQHKYLATQNNLIQSKAVLQEISPRLRYLTRQVNKLARRQELKSKLLELQNNYYGFIIIQIKNKIEETQKKLKERNIIKNNLEENLNNIQDRLNNEEKKNSYAQQFDDLQKEYNQLVNQKNKLVHDRVVYEAKLDLEFSNAGQNNIAWLNTQKSDLDQEYLDNQKTLLEYKNNLKQVNKELDEQTGKQEIFLKKINDLRLKLENNIVNDNDLSATEEFKTKIKKLNNKIKSIIDNIDHLDYANLKKEIYFISKEVEFLNQKINKENAVANDNYQELQTKFQRYLVDKDSYVNEIYKLKNQKSVIETQLNTLERRQVEIKNKLEKINLELQLNQTQDKSDQRRQIEKMIANLNEQISSLDLKIKEAKEKIDTLSTQSEENRKFLFTIQKKAREVQDQLNQENSNIQNINIELAKQQAHYEDLEREMEYEEIDPEGLNYALEDLNKDQVFDEINKYKRQLNQIGGIEEDIQIEFNEVKTKHEFLEKQISDLELASQNLEKIIDDLNTKIDQKFYDNFKKINVTFNKYFQILFNGGQASLTVQKEDNSKKQNLDDSPQENLEESAKSEVLEPRKKTYKGQSETIVDILISVKLPGKKQSNMNVLSGGEKALTSIALICAIIYNNPSPFVVLDEVDAALDEANSERFAEIIDNLKDKTQFICITHNRATMYKAERLYGVTIDENGVSKLLSISFDQAQKYSE